MEDMVSFVSKFVGSISHQETLASFLRKNGHSSSAFPKEYFYLRDLCNPIQYYYNRKGPLIPLTIDRKKEMAYGKKLHELANLWFRKLPEYMVEEGVLDGILVG